MEQGIKRSELLTSKRPALNLIHFPDKTAFLIRQIKLANVLSGLSDYDGTKTLIKVHVKMLWLSNTKLNNSYKICFKQSFILPATAPRIPGIPWVYVISCIPVLVHNGWYFWTDHETTDDVRPTTTPMINEAHTSTEPAHALTPDEQEQEKKTKWVIL